MKPKKNLDLIDSVMSRLDICPSMLTSAWLQESLLSFSEVIDMITADSAPPPVTVVNNNARTEQNAEPAPIDERPAQKETVFLQEADFYENDWSSLDDEFMLDRDTLSQARCGMFVYFQSSKIIVSKIPLARKHVSPNTVFAGILWDRNDQELLTLKLCEQRSGYGRALKKRSANCRFPSQDDCIKMFVYQDLLHEAFRKLHVNFKASETFFCEDPRHSKATAPVFDLKKGTSTALPAKTATAASYQIQTIRITD